MQKRTKIVCTIGPASNTVEKMEALVAAGMNVCRLNFSHGTHEDHATLIERIRTVREKTGEPLTILQDLQGPKIRVGDLPEKGVVLEAGKRIIFTTGTPKIPTSLPVTYAKLHEDVRSGQKILLDDGVLSVVVKEVKGQDVICEVVDGGTLTSHKGMNLPETQTSISAISEKDAADVRFGVEHGVDWIALSFVRSAADIHELRALITEAEQEQGIVPNAPIRILAKIEKPEAITHLEEIVDAVDGIMVARGDLGIEIPAERVPLIQKRLIQLCLKKAKPVIVATQMLDSMIRNPRATRAEISDVANAVIDHTDATMLSGETASGKYPTEAVQTMSNVIIEIEESPLDDLVGGWSPMQSQTERMTNVASLLGKSTQTRAILVASLSGESARLVSRERPEVPIYVASSEERVVHQLNLSWGVKPFLVTACDTLPELIEQGLAHLRKEKTLEAGAEIIVVAGEPLGTAGHVNVVELRTL